MRLYNRGLLFLALACAIPARGASMRSVNFGQTQRSRPGAAAASVMAQGGLAPFDSVTDLCDAAAANLTGITWCMRGDGSSQAGGLALTTTGSGSQSHSYCRAGIACQPRTTQTFVAAASHYLKATGSSPAGSFSTCALFQTSVINSTQILTGKADDAGANVGYLFFIDSASGRIRFEVFKNDSSFTDIQSATNSIVAGMWHLGCATYQAVADGSSVTTLYVDGVASGTPSSTAIFPIQNVTSTYNIGEYTLSLGVAGNIGGAFFTETLLTAAQIAALQVNVMGQFAFTMGGSSASTARTSTRSCANAAATETTLLPNNVPCTNENGYGEENTSTNRVTNSEAFDNASWAKTLATVTADQITGPRGVVTADKLTATSSALAFALFVDSTDTGSSARTASLWLQKGTQGTTASVGFLTDGTQSACVNVTLTTAWQRVQVSATTNPAVALSWGVYPSQNCTTGTSTNGDNVYIWGYQGEKVRYATAYITTGATAVTRNAEKLTTVPNGGWPIASGNVSMSLTPIWGATGIGSVNAVTLAALPSNNGFQPRILSNKVVELQLGDGTGNANLDSAAQTFAIGTTYAFKWIWGGGMSAIFNNNVSIASLASGSKIPTTATATGGFGAQTDGSVACDCYFKSLKVGP